MHRGVDACMPKNTSQGVPARHVPIRVMLCFYVPYVSFPPAHTYTHTHRLAFQPHPFLTVTISLPFTLASCTASTNGYKTPIKHALPFLGEKVRTVEVLIRGIGQLFRSGSILGFKSIFLAVFKYLFIYKYTITLISFSLSS